MPEILYIFLPVAGIKFNVLLLILIGISVGICGGFFGIGGAWIVTPALNIFGFPMAYAIGTDLAHMGGKSIVATIRHSMFGNIDIRLAISMVIGTTLGMELGAHLIMHLEHVGTTETVIRKIYILFLFMIGSYMLYDCFLHFAGKQGNKFTSPTQPVTMTLARKLQSINLPPMIHYRTSGVRCSIWLPILVGVFTGIVASMLGVGGGFIRMPALIYLVGCPTLIAVGTDIFEVMITGAYGAFTYSVKGRVDLLAAIWMLVGAAIGAQLGTVAVKYVRGYFIRLLFAITIFIACISVLCKQLKWQLASSILILSAGLLISLVILGYLFVGIARERAALRSSIKK